MGECGFRSAFAAAIVLSMSVSVAEARKLPKADVAPKLTPCAGMGEGFARIEGSDTCVKLSGSMRAEFAHISSGGSASGDR